MVLGPEEACAVVLLHCVNSLQPCAPFQDLTDKSVVVAGGVGVISENWHLGPVIGSFSRSAHEIIQNWRYSNLRFWAKIKLRDHDFIKFLMYFSLDQDQKLLGFHKLQSFRLRFLQKRHWKIEDFGQKLYLSKILFFQLICKWFFIGICLFGNREFQKNVYQFYSAVEIIRAH